MRIECQRPVGGSRRADRKLLAQPRVVGIGVGGHGGETIERTPQDDEYEARIAGGRRREGEARAECAAAGGKSELQEPAARIVR